MFMIEKSLIIILFVYSCSFSILGAQFIWGDVFHVTLTDFNGQPFKNNLINDININTINQVSKNLASNQTTSIEQAGVNYASAVAVVGVDLFLLATGLYIFDLLLQMGVPFIFVVGMIGLYLFLLIRSILGWVRGI